MDKNLWEKILEFDLDDPLSEYGFSIRIAHENFWTTDFTKKAILEYKKFMYLAATSDFMVSPSEIVDVVWHEHLIFTKSYSDLCLLLGKSVQHIPSTHNREDFEKFKLAKERTKKFYNAAFGEQPADIWEYADMFESLRLAKARFKIRAFIIVAMITCTVLIIPAYIFLKPVYMHIDNPYFILGYLSLLILSFSALEIFNRNYLRNIVERFDGFTFIRNLRPAELVYLQTQDVEQPVHEVVNNLVEEGVIFLNKDHSLELNDDRRGAKTVEDFTAIETLKFLERVYYQRLLKQLLKKPVFSNVPNSMDAFGKYFIKSTAFGRLFYLNFGVLAIVMILGLVRFFLGAARDLPVGQIFAMLPIIAFAIGVYLKRLPKLISTTVIPNFYKTEIISERANADDGEWSYFLFGTTALLSSFVSAVNYTGRGNNSSDSYGSSGGTSCGSSCGSSCSSCGGCGGGD